MPYRDSPLSKESAEILVHLEAERSRVARLANVREVVFGGQDGLVTTATVVTGIYASHAPGTIIMLAGLIAALGGTISMAAGAFTAAKATAQVERAEIEKEIHEIETNPEAERKELITIFESRGMTDDEAESVADTVAHHRDLMIEMLLAFELGLTREGSTSPHRAAGVMGTTFFFLSVVPLLPFLAGATQAALVASLALVLVGLAGLGVTKARLAGLGVLRSAGELVAIGTGSAIAGYALGAIASRILGVQV